MRDLYLSEHNGYTMSIECVGECGRVMDVVTDDREHVIRRMGCRSEIWGWINPGHMPECAKCLLDISQELVLRNQSLGGLFNEHESRL